MTKAWLSTQMFENFCLIELEFGNFGLGEVISRETSPICIEKCLAVSIDQSLSILVSPEEKFHS